MFLFQAGHTKGSGRVAETVIWIPGPTQTAGLTVDVFPASRGEAIARDVVCTPHPDRGAIVEFVLSAPVNGIIYLVLKSGANIGGWFWAAVRDDDGVYYAVDSIAEAVMLQTLTTPGMSFASKNDDPVDFTDVEAIILEALGENTLTGPKLAGAAGFLYNSQFRNRLSQLVKRGELTNVPRKGYSRKN